MDTMINGNGYPIFEPNQVLKNTDLNRIVSYLDNQNRLTRSHLIGMGIVCGLTIESTIAEAKTEIRIAPGCGITSEGYFIYYPTTNNPGERTFTHFRDIEVARQSFGLPEGTPDKVRVRELVAATTVNDQEELLPLSVVGDLAQQVVAVLCDWEDTPRDSCLVDCDDRGRDRNFRLRFLLLHREALAEVPQTNGWLDATTLLQAGYQLQSNQDLATYFQGWYDVPDCTIKRFGYQSATSPAETDGVDLSKIVSFDLFKTAYNRVCREAITSIDNALTAIHQLFGPFFGHWKPDENDFDGLNARLTGYLDSLLARGAATGTILPTYGLQYFYDYLTELIAAYRELKNLLFDVMADCMPSLGRFPKYLLLGEASGEAMLCGRPSVYRHHFTQPPIYNGNAQRLKEAHHLYTRLLHMSQEFVLLPFYQTPVKVTPSRSRVAPLGDQAIPYYYSYPQLLPYWNYDACRKLRINQLPAYFRPPGLPNPRGYDLSERLDQFDFFRIEGHVGLPLMEAIERIEGYKQDFNLAFDLVAVRLGEAGPEADPILKGYFDDLELEFDQIKGTWEKKRGKTEQSIKDPTINQILASFHNFFFRHEDLAKIDPGLMENDLLKLARNSSNYQFQEILGQTGEYRLVVNFNSTPARVAFVPSEGEGGIQPNSPRHFTLTDTEHFTQNQQRIIETFATCFSLRPTTLQVVLDNNVFRFVVRDGRENIELLESPTNPNNQDLPNLLLALEDETPYNAQGLIERYHDFDALFTFLQYFGESSGLLSSQEASELIPYYEFRALFRRYLLRLETVKQLQLLPEYARKHRGLEHLGGVPKGGTLVLVYTGESEVTRDLIAADSAVLNISDQQAIAIKTQAQFPVGKLEIGKRNHAITNNRINRNVVIADFCLPYLCCSPYSSLNYVMAPPKPFIGLPQAVYCEGDENIYDFILDPPGGLLKGGDGIVDHNGNYAFQPSTVDADVTEPMNLTFFYIVDGVGSSYSILLLPHVEIRFWIYTNDNPTCVLPGKPKLIYLNAEPDGGTFRLSINEGPSQSITVNNRNEFDLGSVPFPVNQNTLNLRFIYTVPNTDDYCGGTSEPQDLLLIRQPEAKIDYPKNEKGQAIGTLIYGSDCSVMGLQIEFRNDASKAQTYEWQLNSDLVAKTAIALITIPYTAKITRTKVDLIVRNYNNPDSFCEEQVSANVVLAPLNSTWNFDDKNLPTRTTEDGEKRIVLCHTAELTNYQKTLTVAQPGGKFSSESKELTVSLTNAELPCEQQTGYTLDFANTPPGIYTLTYTLPDQSSFERQIEVVRIPAVSFNLAVQPVPPNTSNRKEQFDLIISEVQPNSREGAKLDYSWTITIGNNAPITTKQKNNRFTYDDKVQPGDPITVVMSASAGNGICTATSKPRTVRVPLIITGFELYRLEQEDSWRQVVPQIKDNARIEAQNLGKSSFNIRAITFPSRVGSVVFELQVPPGQSAPPTPTLDNQTPYDLYHDEQDRRTNNWRPSPGEFTIKATPYPKPNREGEPGTERQVKFELVEQESDRPQS